MTIFVSVVDSYPSPYSYGHSDMQMKSEQFQGQCTVLTFFISDFHLVKTPKSGPKIHTKNPFCGRKWSIWVIEGMGECIASQGRIHVWSESAPAPPFWQINHANSAYFRLFWDYFRVISATRPPFWISAPPFYISWIRPCILQPWSITGAVAGAVAGAVGILWRLGHLCTTPILSVTY